MDVENMLEVEDNLDNLIKIEGNFFIMDSEQLVSNPFQELQQEAMNEANANISKKNSMTEKLTMVKNNVCENHYQMARASLDRQKASRLKQLHDNSNRLRHQVKLLDLDRQRHNVEVKKRLEPYKDHSYDDSLIHNTERRLGANIASFYLDKKLKYPMRMRSVQDIRVTPTISKARAKMRESDLNKQFADDMSIGMAGSRANTAKTITSSFTSSSAAAVPSATLRRRNSRSAPHLYNRNTRSATSITSHHSNKPLFPDIGNRNQRPTKSAKDAGGQNPNANHQVKFTFENPLKILASSEESANMFARSCSYYPGSTKAVNIGWESSDEDDDDLSQAELVDLRAILFPDDNNNGNSINRQNNTPSNSLASLSQHQLWAIRKAQGPPPKLSTAKKEAEAKLIGSKINSFLERIAEANRRKKKYDYDSDSDGESVALNFVDSAPLPVQNNVSRDAHTPNPFSIPIDNDLIPKNTNSVLPERISESRLNQQPPTSTSQPSTQQEATRKVAKKPTLATKTSIKQNTPINNDDQRSDSDKSEHLKYSWRCIRAKNDKGGKRNSERSRELKREELVLQALTGVPIQQGYNTHVPMRSACRAMRHTATFKMYQIVERLINERTKYERHQVDEIKRHAADGEAEQEQQTIVSP